MSGGENKRTRKQAYFTKLIKLLDTYNKLFICGVDNVGSAQLQKIRKSIRGKGEVLMGKNSMIRKAIRGHIQNNPSLNVLVDKIKGNVGFVFVAGDMSEVKKLLDDSKVAAPAKAGTVAPSDVFVPPQVTGLEPTQTSFFQALNIPTKINKGAIEITNEVHLLRPGQKIGTSEAALLQKLDIKPFRYGLVIKTVYDNGTIYDAKVLDITDEVLIRKFQVGVRNVACVSLAIHDPNITSLPHILARGFKNVLSVALGADFEIKQTKQLLTAAAAPVQPVVAATTAAPAAKKEPVKEEVKEEEDDGPLGLFD